MLDMPKPIFFGKSANGSLDAAISDAIGQAHAYLNASGFADGMINAEIDGISVNIGGVAGLSEVVVKLRAK
jgi:hypothetical protein